MSWLPRRRRPERPGSSGTGPVSPQKAERPAADEGPVPQGPRTAPLSRERLERLVQARGWQCQTDEEGDLVLRVGDDLISLLLRGEHDEVLNVLGQMVEDIPMSRLDEARFAIEEWHREHLWPVCFWRDNDDAGLTFTIGGSLAVDWEPGATDAQLLQHLDYGVLACGEAFTDFRNRLAAEPYGGPSL